MRLVFTLFKLPFWVFLAAACGLFYLGELAHRDTHAKNQEMAQALAGQPPETTTFAAFSRQEHVGLAQEISVLATINPGYNYELTKKRKGVDTVRYMFVLFDPADPDTSKTARGAMVLTPAEKDKFFDDYILKHGEITYSDTGFVTAVTLNGRMVRSTDLSSMVSDAFQEQGLTKSADFVYVAPFLNGRTAGLTPTVTANEMRNVIRGVAAIVALIGLAKLMARRRKKNVPGASETSDMTEVVSPLDPKPIASVVQSTSNSPDARAKQSTKPIVIKGLGVVVLLGVSLYFGVFAFVAVAALLALQFYAVKKTKGVIERAVSRVAGKAANPNAHDEDVMAKVEIAAKEMSGETEPEKPTNRGFGFVLPSLSRKTIQAEDPDATHAANAEPELAPQGDTANKPSWARSLPGFKAIRSGDENDELESVSAENASETHFPTKRIARVSLPFLGKKAVSAKTDLPSEPAPKSARKKTVFSGRKLFSETQKPEADSLSDKLQLLCARLSPAERTPKAFAGRPDPFDRLAEDARRAATR